MNEEHLSPRDATRKSMGEIAGALIGIALVLAAVFVPVAFFGGSVGVIYRQFSITLVSAMTLSVLTALILTPALCATLLQPLPPGGHAEHRGFGWFNRGFAAGTRGYDRGLKGALARPGRMMLIYVGVVALMGVLFARIPTSFLPPEDAGMLYGQVQTPPGASKERTWAALDAAREYLLTQEKDIVDGVLTVAGFNFAGTGQNSGLVFVKLRPWDERRRAEQSSALAACR
jgi:multidrug efflux pump